MGREPNDPVSARAVPPQALTDEGACRGTDPRLFFPVTVGELRMAVSICNRCSVKTQCLDWALETGQAHGVYGGVAAEKRLKALRRTS